MRDAGNPTIALSNSCYPRVTHRPQTRASNLESLLNSQKLSLG
ncbi:hypothetical protein CKA32_006914 [Geitlerinema sp. FC II]|nr:hypothetical protein CKA32_006914 [Geitlerinema sp. FC II]